MGFHFPILNWILKQCAECIGLFRQLDGVFHLSKQKSECDNIPKWVSWQTLFNLVEENFGHTKSSEEFLFFFFLLNSERKILYFNSQQQQQSASARGGLWAISPMKWTLKLIWGIWSEKKTIPPLYKLVVISMLQTYTLVGVIGIWTPYPVKF